MRRKRSFFVAVLICIALSRLSSQTEELREKISIDFRNQKIADIILSVADMCGESVSIDDTVSGSATFHFEDTDFDTALKRFAESCRIFVEKRDGIYYLTKVRIEKRTNGYYVDGEDVPVIPFLMRLSRDAHVTIMYESLPNVTVTVRTEEATVEELMELVMLRLSGYTLETSGKGYFISRGARGQNGRSTEDFGITVKDGLYSLSLKKALSGTVFDALFKKAGKEYALLNKTAVALENLYYTDKDFDTLLHLILEQSNSDCSLTDGIYYIFEIQRKDILKKLKTTKAVHLVHVSAESVMALFPAELNASSFSRIDKAANTIYITGSEEETKPIIDFLGAIDIPIEGRYYQRFTTKNMAVSEVVPLIPKSILYTDTVILPNSMTFVTQVTEERERLIREYLTLIDRKDAAHAVRLRYIQSDELFKYLPPSIKKENITVTGDTALVFFTGPEETFDTFKKELSLIDKPKQQVRYQVLVIQHQKTSGFKWEPSLQMEKVSSTGNGLSYAATLGSLLNVSFDIVSQFGIRFAASLAWELSSGKARVLADTTLNGISGEAISFSNTNVYRYRDIVKDNTNNVYSSTTREISSGLTLSIKGWVSGDDMITVAVDARVSKQGTTSDTTVPPPTSEKKVTTNVRAKSGSPVIIGGLMQSEKDVSIQKTPILGSIPLIGRVFRKTVESTADTEFVIYLVPFVERGGSAEEKSERGIRRYYEKYVATKS